MNTSNLSSSWHEHAEEVSMKQFSNLKYKVIACFQTYPDKIWYFTQSVKYKHIQTEQDFFRYVEQVFDQYDKFKSIWEYISPTPSPWAVSVYKNITELLIVSGEAQLITAWDWSVNRKRLAEKCNWLKRDWFRFMQSTLWKKYGWESPIHVHKWPGNGVLPHDLLVEGTIHTDIANWQQAGVWDKLYFAMEDILQKFLKLEYQNNTDVLQFVEVLSTILKARLKEKWFESGTASIQDWKKKHDFCDVNDIFWELKYFLNNPEKWLLSKFQSSWNKNIKSQLFLPETGKIRTSKYFEYDSVSSIKLELHGILLRLLGKTQRETVDILSKRFATYRQEKVKSIKRNINRLTDVRESLKKSWHIPKHHLIQEISALTDAQVCIDRHLYKQEDAISDINTYISGKNKELTSLNKAQSSLRGKTYTQRKNILKKHLRSDLGIFEENITPQELCTKFFDDRFSSRTLSGNHKWSLNLNQETSMYFWDFSLGYFEEIPELIPEKVHVFSATRSDSHEDEETFYRDIKQNLNWLAPWWVLLTDGIKASFTHIYRFREIKKALKECWEDNFNVDVVVDKETRLPISIFIQKKHPQWYLTPEEKYQFFDRGWEFITLEEALSIPYVKVSNIVRRKVYDLTSVSQWDKKSVDIFEALQSNIRSDIDAVFLEVAMTKSSWNDYTQSILEAYKELAPQIFPLVSEETIESKIASITESQYTYLFRDNILLSLLKKYNWKSLDSWTGEQWIEKNRNKKDISEIKEKIAVLQEMFECQTPKQLYAKMRQHIRNNIQEEFFSKQDISTSIEKVEERIQKALHLYEWALSQTQEQQLNPIKKGYIYMLPRYGPGIGISPINWKHVIRRGSLSQNTKLVGNQEHLKKQVERIKSRVLNFRKSVRKKERQSKYKPICFISYQDCITNTFMIQELQNILWEKFVEENVEVVSIDFHPREEVSDDTIQHLHSVWEKINKYQEHGGIIIGGWSWTDSHDSYGDVFKQYIWRDLLDAVEKNKKLKMFLLCASYQIMWDIIWEKYFSWDIKTEPGMMQFWATNVHIKKGKNRPEISNDIFKGAWDHITTSMTHSSWLLDNRQKNKKHANTNILEFHANDVVTWHPLAYSAIDGRIIGIQWHPEVDLKNTQRLKRLSEELKEHRDFFKKTFKTGPRRIMHNFLQASDYVQVDSWETIIVNILDSLTKRL